MVIQLTLCLSLQLINSSTVYLQVRETRNPPQQVQGSTLTCCAQGRRLTGHPSYATSTTTSLGKAVRGVDPLCMPCPMLTCHVLCPHWPTESARCCRGATHYPPPSLTQGLHFEESATLSCVIIFVVNLAFIIYVLWCALRCVSVLWALTGRGGMQGLSPGGRGGGQVDCDAVSRWHPG